MIAKTLSSLSKLTITLALSLPACANEDWRELAAQLQNLPQAQSHSFGLHDHDGRSMDCLEVFQSGENQKIYGIYHTMRKGVFSVHLAKTTDLKNWTHLTELDSHASQPSIHETAEGSFLVAYEKDAPNSCWIKLRHYKNLDALRQGKVNHEFEIPRSLAPTAEGTPSFESVKITDGDLSNSEIKLRFHFYQNARVDQLASGTLKNFKDWKAAPSTKLNQQFKSRGGKGNLGDRDRFLWKGKFYYVQEIQGAVGDWGSWGIYLCDHHGSPLQKLAIKTPKKATAFSNPAVSWVRDSKDEKKLVFTAFLHSRGTHRSEVGQFMSVIFPK